jgi:anti-sigma regulatory factor (Ser/Thr protein kinase)
MSRACEISASRSKASKVADGAVRLTYAAEASTLRSIRERVEETCGRLLSSTECEDLKVAVTEACANAVLHSGTQEFRVTISELDDCIEVVVEDDGVYRSTPAPVDGDSKSHRGLLLMAAMVDDLRLRRGTESAGTQVRLRKCAS